MKRAWILILAAVCVLAFSGCFCAHEWKEADCLSPQTCLNCEKTKGDALGHDWQDANCETAKTCTRCGETEGAALGHQWQDATTESPKTCVRCEKTEGERIVTDPRFTTSACEPLFGTWSCTVDMDGKSIGLESYSKPIPCVCTYVFGNDGTVVIHRAPVDMDEFLNQVKEHYTTFMYDNFAATGISRQEADDAMLSIYGMTMADFVEAMLEERNINANFDTPASRVYYVKNGKVFMGDDWDSEMTGSVFSILGETMTIGDELHDADVVTLKRVQ